MSKHCAIVKEIEGYKNYQLLPRVSQLQCITPHAGQFSLPIFFSLVIGKLEHNLEKKTN